MIRDTFLYINCGLFLCVVVGGEVRNCSTIKPFWEVGALAASLGYCSASCDDTLPKLIYADKFTDWCSISKAIQMCGEGDTFYSFPRASDLEAMVHMGRSSLPFNVTTFCSCNVTIHPIPRVINWRHRTSLLGGCRILPTMMSKSNTQECLTDRLQVNVSLENETLFQSQTINNDSYVCFGVKIEDAYVEGRSFNVTCSQAETSPIPLDVDPNSFKISTQLDQLTFHSDNFTDPRLMLTYSTSIVFDKKYYETSPLSVKPTYHDANHGNTRITKKGKEAIKVQSDEKWIQNVVIGVSSGGVSLILLVVVVLINKRVKRRKRDHSVPAVKYTITVQRDDNEDLVITDNLVYNLDEEENNVNVNVDGDHVHHLNHSMLVNDMQEDENSNANHKEVEYTNSLEIGRSITQSEQFEDLTHMSKKEGNTSEQDVLTDDEKMDLYANKFISRNKSLVVEDLVYSNEFL